MNLSDQLRSAKLRVIVAAIILLLVPGILAWRVFREPVYLGKRLSVWVRDLRGTQPWHSKLVERLRPTLPKQWQTKLPNRVNPDDLSQQAQWVLIHFGPQAKPAIPALIRLLEDSDPVVRCKAAFILEKIAIGNDRAFAALLRIVRDPNEVVRYYAVVALGNLGATNQTFTSELITLLLDDSTLVVGETLRALNKIGAAPTSAISKIRAKLQSSNAHVRLFAAEALWRISGETNQPTEVTINLLTTGGSNVRSPAEGFSWASLTALGAGITQNKLFFQQRSAEMIIRAIGPGWDSVGPSAAELLLKMHPALRESVPPLPREAQRMEDARKLMAARVLWRINHRSPPIPPLVALIDSQHQGIREYAVDSLAEFGAPVASLLISRLERASDTTSRIMTMALLGRLGPTAEPAIPLLVTSLRQTNEVPELSAVAAQALGNIGVPNEEVISALREALEDQTAQFQNSAARALASIGLTTEDLVSKFRESLENRRLTVQLAAAEALWKLKRDFKSVEPVIRRALVNKLPEIRIKALQLIATIGPAARSMAPLLTPLLQNKDEDVRHAANEALQRINRSRGL